RLCRPQVAEVLAAEPFACAGAAHQPGHVTEPDRRRHLFAGRDRLRERVDAGIRDGSDTDVGRGLYARVGGHLGVPAGERVEEGRLAGVGQAADADLEARHQRDARTEAPPTAAPSASPAAASEAWCTPR